MAATPEGGRRAAVEVAECYADAGGRGEPRATCVCVHALYEARRRLRGPA